MVNIIIESNQITEPKFWNSWKGFIIREIVLANVYKRDEIIKRTQIQEEQFDQALRELFQNELITERSKGCYWINSELCKEYRLFFSKLQDNLVNWVNQWRLQENLESKLNHFYLEDRLLYDFSQKLIANANMEILVANPYVKKCHISEALKTMSKKGIIVELITRHSNNEYIKVLTENGVSIIYDDSVHAKLTVVDRRVGISSSMNYYAGSTGGELWEAGIVTLEESTVQSIAKSILKKT